MADDDGFLSRWSRRKISEKHREEIPTVDVAEDPQEALDAVGDATPDGVADEELGGGPAETDQPERHPAEDIDIDSLTKDSDFTIFMQKGVSAALRRKALRKLWTSDPVLANLDGLNDYEDMERTYGISVAANTDWTLGRGFLTDKDLGLAEPAETDTGDETGEPADVAVADQVAGADPPDDTADPEDEDEPKA